MKLCVEQRAGVMSVFAAGTQTSKISLTAEMQSWNKGVTSIAPEILTVSQH